MSSLEIGVTRRDGLGAPQLAAISRGALDRTLVREAELLVAVPADEAVVLGAFQRGADVAQAPGTLPLWRGSGGAAARVGPGTVWMQLALARSDALVACDASKLLNRYVRPLLAALTRSGALAHYFGRDWVSVAHRPAALVAFAHDATSGRALVEAIVAVGTRFDLGPRASFMGKEPLAIAQTAKGATPARVADAIVAAYLEAYGRTAVEVELPAGATGERVGHDPEPPWVATREEAIGVVAAGRDRTGCLRVGGEIMASRDAIANLEAGLRAADADVGALVDATLAAPGVTLFGVRALATVRDVILEASR